MVQGKPNICWIYDEMDKLKYGQYRSKVSKDQNMDHKSKSKRSKDHHEQYLHREHTLTLNACNI